MGPVCADRGNGVPPGAHVGIGFVAFAKQTVEPEVVVAPRSASPVTDHGLCPHRTEVVVLFTGDEPRGQLPVRGRIGKRKKAGAEKGIQPVIQGGVAVQGGIGPYAPVFVQQEQTDDVRKGGGGNR